MWIFLGLQFVPFLPFGWAFLITFFVVLFLIFRWMVKFGGIQTNDADYRQAKRSAILAVVLWLAAIPTEILLSMLRQIASPF